MTMKRYITSPLPDSCKIIWKPEWGRVIVIRLKNSSGNGMLKSEITQWNNHDDQWFGNQAKLGEINKDIYSSPDKIFVYKDFETNEKLFSYYWHNKFDRLEEGQLPPNLSSEKLTHSLSGNLFTRLYDHIKSI